MELYVTLVPSRTRTRVVVKRGRAELLKASLPPLAVVKHRRAATTLLEALSLWLDARLCVALSADAPEDCFCFGLTDELGVGKRSVFYAVEVVPVHEGGASPRRPGEGACVRQLPLVARPGGLR